MAAPTKTVREARFTYEGVEYSQREPGIEETNLADLIRSKVFFEAIRQGVRTEAEIMGTMIDQGRFNEEEYHTTLEKHGAKVREALIAMGLAEDQDSLVESHRRAKRARTQLMSAIRQRQSYSLHSAEQKADNAFNVALVGIVTSYASGSNKGKSVLLKRNPDTEEIDIEATYKNSEDQKNAQFVTAALRCFMPFSMGLNGDDMPDDPEDTLLIERLQAFTEGESEQDLAEIKAEIADVPATETEQEDEEEDTVIVISAPEKVEEPVFPEMPEPTPAPEPVVAPPAPSKPRKRTSNEDMAIGDGGGVKVGGPQDTVHEGGSMPANWTPPPISTDMVD